MTQAEAYDEFMTEFPAVWAHEHSWVNVHDGKAPKLDVLLDILNTNIREDRAVVVVHSPFGIGAELPLGEVCAFVAPHVLEAEIQVADPEFTTFVAILINGVAAGWR